MPKIFLICSVRNATDNQKRFQKNYVDGLQRAGHEVFWPPVSNYYDLPQNADADKIGIDTINTNLEAILNSDEVHIIFDPKSEGSIADLEAAMALRKPIHSVNKDQLVATEKRSYTNVVIKIEEDYIPSRMYKERVGFAKPLY